MVVCLVRDADLHIAQLMLLPTRVVPDTDKGPLNGCVCVCVCVYYEGYRFKTYRYTVKVPDTVIMNVNRNVCFVCCAEPSSLDGSVHCINS